MTASNTIRTHCLECDPDRRKSKSLETYPNGTRYCFRCHCKSRPCSKCGETFEYRHPNHERCDTCFRDRSDQHVAEWIKLTEESEKLAQLEPVSEKPKGGRGKSAGVRKAARDLGIEKEDARRAVKVASLADIWARTQPLRGSSIGENYAEHRKLVLPPVDSDLRFLPGNDRYPPTLCALVTNAMTAKPMTLHFTRLAADGKGKAGTDRDKLLLRGHPKAGGVIRLWHDEAVTHGLAIAEGIESALAAAHLFTPVWSTVDAGNMKKFPVLDGIEALTIYADNDLAGLDAARACGRRWRDAGREVRVLRSRVLGHDIADEVAA